VNNASRVLIVARTRYRGGACVGGIDLERGRNLRLTDPDVPGSPTPAYRIGDLWDLEYDLPGDLLPPHLEDVIAYGGTRRGRLPELREFLVEREQPWEGPPERLFEGLLQPTGTGSGYISAGTGVPECSVGFWLPDQPLRRLVEGTTVRYRYPGPYGVRSLTYVGFEPTVPELPAGALLRVSLARWWKNPDAPGQEARCYLQLSGWYR
jgi:ATP-dependent DNA helicase RecQ